MEVGDGKSIKSAQVRKSAQAKPSKGNQKPSSKLSQPREAVALSAPVSLEVSPKQASNKKNAEVQRRINEISGVINLAADVAGEIDLMARSIDGIVEQVIDKEVPEKHLNVLQEEANSLVRGMREKAQGSQVNGIAPLSGEKVIRFEIEQSVGKALELVIPDGANNAFGIGDIKFSQKDAIIDVQTNIAVARDRIQQLRDSVEASRRDLSKILVEVDVAEENDAASRSSLRELDEALALAGKAEDIIRDDPKAAMESSKLSEKSLRLLDFNK